MHFVTLITLTLVALLILSVRLLFTFSYDTFIPLYIEFGIYVYFASISIIYLARKYYFYQSINSPDKKLNDFIYVVLPALLSLGIAIFILLLFEDYGISGGSSGAAYQGLFIFSILFFIALAISVLFFLSAKFKFNADSHAASLPFNNFFKKSAFLVIPILTVAITYTLFLAYSDFYSAGIKHGYSDKSNRSAIKQKAIEKQDISFCDHIKNTYDIEYSIKDCYDDFFQKNDKISKFNKLRKAKIILYRKDITDPKKIDDKYNLNYPKKYLDLDNSKDFTDPKMVDDKYNLIYLKKYLDLYNQMEKTCSRSKKQTLCETMFHQNTKLIMHPFYGFQIIFDGKKPTYFLIRVTNFSRYSSDIHNLLIEDLEYLTDEYISLIEKSPNNDSLTNIHLHLEKLVNNPDKLKEIRNIISSRKQNLLIAFQQNKIKIEKEAELKRQKEKEKLIEVRSKFLSEMRLKFKLKPDDILKQCQIKEYYTCVCSIPMCINDKFLYNYPRIFDRVFLGTDKYLATSMIPESTMLRCLINHKEDKAACHGFTKKDNDTMKIYTLKESMELKKQIELLNKISNPHLILKPKLYEPYF